MASLPFCIFSFCLILPGTLFDDGDIRTVEHALDSDPDGEEEQFDIQPGTHSFDVQLVVLQLVTRVGPVTAAHLECFPIRTEPEEREILTPSQARFCACSYMLVKRCRRACCKASAAALSRSR